MKSNTKHTLVIGGSIKPERYSNKAIRKLLKYGHKVSSIGLKEGDVSGIKIETGLPNYKDIHTVSMYLDAVRQSQYFEYVLGLKPQRVVFNPGAENSEFAATLKINDIEVVEHCTLVMLDYGLF